jgi:hypothetical protein
MRPGDRFIHACVDFIIILSVKRAWTQKHMSTDSWKSGRFAAQDMAYKGESFIVGLGIWNDRWKQLVKLLHLADQFVVKGPVTDFNISCKGIRVILIQ